MSDKPSSQTLRLVEGRERHRCIVCDRYLRAGEWPGMTITQETPQPDVR